MDTEKPIVVLSLFNGLSCGHLALDKIMNNPNFKPIEFDRFRKEAGLNSFTMSPKKWIEATGANNPSAVVVKCKETGEIFDTCKKAAIFCGLKGATTILKCAKGTRNKAGGYTWEIVSKKPRKK